MITFKDNFSQQSDIYVKYRPQYPVELYSFLSSLTEGHELVWDCGTGNGQAAVGLAAFYDRVVATDPSEQQIINALPHDRVQYAVEKAEQTSLPDHCADMVTIANALHWFDLDVFYREVRRVLKPGGVVAAWAYGIPTIEPAVDALLHKFHFGILDSYWRPENRLVEQEYRTIAFPFEQVVCPGSYSEKMMSVTDMIGYLNTWSAVQRFINEQQYNPTDQLAEELRRIWQEEEVKTVRWKLILKAGRVNNV